MADVSPRGEAEPLAPAADDDEKLEAELAQETEDVIYQELQEKGAHEPLRATLLYIAMWQVHHARARVLHLPKGTLYTASVVMPMIARSSGYTMSMTTSAVKQVLLTLVCIALQGSMLESLFTARVKLPGLDGVPSMCTYGQDVGSHRQPYGPTGQLYERNYGNVETDYTMVMVRNTLYEVMKKVGVENSSIGPVEYGMESTTCRFVCVMVFCVAICAEVFSMEAMLRFVIHSPTLPAWTDRKSSPLAEENEERRKCMWICFDSATKGPRAKELWALCGKNSLDHIKFQCAGMPMSWKLFTIALLVVRAIVVFLTFWNGLAFLMNTGSILELILNSLALTFIIELDPLMFKALSRGVSKEIMGRLEPLHVKAQPGTLSEELAKRRASDVAWSYGALLRHLVDINAATLVLLSVTLVGHFIYFIRHCEMEMMPFDFRELGAESYFVGQTRLLGGWQFLFGSWYSKPTIDLHSGKVTCDPAHNSPLTGEVLSRAQGCGLPEAWAPR